MLPTITEFVGKFHLKFGFKTCKNYQKIPTNERRENKEDKDKKLCSQGHVWIALNAQSKKGEIFLLLLKQNPTSKE